MWFRMSRIFVRYCLIGRVKNQVKFMIFSTEHILQCSQSEPQSVASGMIVDLMNENQTGVPRVFTLCKHNPQPQCQRLVLSDTT